MQQILTFERLKLENMQVFPQVNCFIELARHPEPDASRHMINDNGLNNSFTY